MTISLASVSHLIDTIYDGPFAADPWTALANGLEETLRGRVAVFRRSEDRVATLVPCTHAEGELMAVYEQSYWQEDRAMQMLFASPCAEIVRDSSLVDDAERPRLGFYHDYLASIGAGRGLYAAIGRDQQDLLVISAQRPRSAGDYEQSEVQLVRELLPHVRRSVQIRRKLTASHLENNAFIQALEHLGAGVILVDADARMQFANRGAEREFSSGVLRLAGQKVSARTERHTAFLRRAIAAAAVASGAVADRLTLPHCPTTCSRSAPAQILVAPVRASQLSGLQGDPLAMLILGNQESAAVDDEQLRSVYGLTPAEARLLGALVKGERLGSYAERSGVSLSTVKTHLSSLFSKTGEQRQADLIRRALKDAGLRIRED